MEYAVDGAEVRPAAEFAEQEVLVPVAGEAHAPLHLGQEPGVEPLVAQGVLVDIVVAAIDARDPVHVLRGPLDRVPVVDGCGVGGQEFDIQAAGPEFVVQCLMVGAELGHIAGELVPGPATARSPRNSSGCS